MCKKSFVVYSDIDIDGLSFEDKGKLFQAMLDFHNNQQNVILEGELKGIFRMIKRQFERDIEEEKCYLYIAEFFSQEEGFIKISISHNPNKRFSAFRSLGFDIITIKILEFENEITARIKEEELHTEFSKYQYYPDQSFGGQYECFSHEILPMLKEMENEK